MISFRLAGQLIVHMWQNFNVAIFSDTTSMINVKLCMVVVLTELHPFIPHSATLMVFQGHSSAKQFDLKILWSYLIKLKLFTIVDYVMFIMKIPPFFICLHMFKGVN